jgi:NADPH-dependent curcumin reductase CurA
MKEPEITLNGWITIKALADQKGCTTNYISNLIKQGKIPFREHPLLKGFKLVPENYFINKKAGV